jgi:hypothetical protein
MYVWGRCATVMCVRWLRTELVQSPSLMTRRLAKWIPILPNVQAARPMCRTGTPDHHYDGTFNWPPLPLLSASMEGSWKHVQMTWLLPMNLALTEWSSSLRVTSIPPTSYGQSARGTPLMWTPSWASLALYKLIRTATVMSPWTIKGTCLGRNVEVTPHCAPNCLFSNDFRSREGEKKPSIKAMFGSIDFLRNQFLKTDGSSNGQLFIQFLEIRIPVFYKTH